MTDPLLPCAMRASTGSRAPAWRSRYQTQAEYEAEGIAVTQAALAECVPFHARVPRTIVRSDTDSCHSNLPLAVRLLVPYAPSQLSHSWWHWKAVYQAKLNSLLTCRLAATPEFQARADTMFSRQTELESAKACASSRVQPSAVWLLVCGLLTASAATSGGILWSLRGARHLEEPGPAIETAAAPVDASLSDSLFGAVSGASNIADEGSQAESSVVAAPMSARSHQDLLRRVGAELDVLRATERPSSSTPRDDAAGDAVMPSAPAAYDRNACNGQSSDTSKLEEVWEELRSSGSQPVPQAPGELAEGTAVAEDEAERGDVQPQIEAPVQLEVKLRRGPALPLEAQNAADAPELSGVRVARISIASMRLPRGSLQRVAQALAPSAAAVMRFALDPPAFMRPVLKLALAVFVAVLCAVVCIPCIPGLIEPLQSEEWAASEQAEEVIGADLAEERTGHHVDLVTELPHFFASAANSPELASPASSGRQVSPPHLLASAGSVHDELDAQLAGGQPPLAAEASSTGEASEHDCSSLVRAIFPQSRCGSCSSLILLDHCECLLASIARQLQLKQS